MIDITWCQNGVLVLFGVLGFIFIFAKSIDFYLCVFIFYSKVGCL